MKTKDLNKTLVGKRVKGIYTGLAYEGTVIGITEDRDIYWSALLKGFENRTRPSNPVGR